MAEKPQLNPAKSPVGDSISEFAKLGVKAEEEAVTLYREIIETSGKMGDWETRELFEKIYGEEEAAPIQIPRIHKVPRRKRRTKQSASS